MAEPEIIFDKTITDFLKSIAVFNDRAVFEKEDNTLVAKTANSEIAYKGVYKSVIYNNINDSIRLNVPNIVQLQNFISSLKDDTIKFEYQNSYLKYVSKQLKLKYQLLEDGIISSCKLNIDKALNLDFNVKFDLNKEDIVSVIKLLSYGPSECKLYFYTQNNCLYVDIADKEKTNTNETSWCLKENIDYEFSGMIIPAETFRILNTINFDKINIQINTDLYIMVATINDDSYDIYYVITGREK